MIELPKTPAKDLKVSERVDIPKFEDVVERRPGGRIKIKDSSAFIKILSLKDPTNESTKKAFQTLLIFGRKQMNTYFPDIPYEDRDTILHMAIAKAIRDFQEGKANIAAFLWDKIRGEVHTYRVKRNSEAKKVMKLVNSGEGISNEEYHFRYDHDSQETKVETIDGQTMEETMLAQDYCKRQLLAFRMAFSQLPRESQFVLYEIGEGRRIREIAEIINKDEHFVMFVRNRALGLILKKIMRSRFLTEDEKREILSLHGVA